MNAEKGLPVNIEVEMLLLGSAMARSSDLDTIRPALTEDDFSLEKHKRIWRKVCAIYDAGGKVDRITVYSALRDAGEAEACDGLSYLVSLDEGLPQIPNLDSYVQIVKEKALRRRVIASAQHLMNQALSENVPVEDLLTGLGETAVKLSDTTSTEKPISTLDLIEKVGIDALLSPRRHGEIRLPWKRLDAALSGFSGGQVIVLLGETSRGKTSFALQAAAYVAGQDKTVLIWTMEMSPRSLFRRLVMQMSGVPIAWNPSQMSFEERDMHRMAVAHLANHPIYFDRHSRSVASFAASVRQVRAKSDLALVIVDYLQLIRSNNRQTRAQQVSENSRNIKLAAMDFNVPWLVLSQVDRASVKKDGEIGIHSAKESGDVENDADVLLWIKAKELSRDRPTPVSIMIGKQREGSAGWSIPMGFNPKSQTFLESTDDDEG